MSTTTRMRVSNSVQVYHRVAAANDMGQHDVGTNDANASGLGGSGDFEIYNSSDVDYVTAHKVADATGGGVAIATSDAINDFLFIKHTGYQESTKATATTQLLKVGVGDPDAVGFSLSPGESICLHGFGTSTSNIDDWFLESASGDIYVEVVYGAD